MRNKKTEKYFKELLIRLDFGEVFVTKVLRKMYEKIKEKGITYRKCPIQYLIDRFETKLNDFLYKSYKIDDLRKNEEEIIDIINYGFMLLHNLEGDY